MRLAATPRHANNNEEVAMVGKDATIFDGVVPHPRIGTRRSVVHARRSGIHAHGSGEAHAHAHTGEAADLGLVAATAPTPRTAPDPAGRQVEGGRGLSKGEGGGQRPPRRQRKRGGGGGREGGWVGMGCEWGGDVRAGAGQGSDAKSYADTSGRVKRIEMKIWVRESVMVMGVMRSVTTIIKGNGS
jgi:hypothetical protein